MKIKVLILTLLISVLSWGQETLSCPAGTIVGTTMTFATTNFTIVHAKGSDSNFASYSPWRVYTNNTVTFTGGAGVQRITSIEITTVNATYAIAAVGGTQTVVSGTGTISGVAAESIATFTVTGSDVTAITIKPSAQSRWSSITINYESAVTPPEVLVSATSLSGFNYLFGNGPSAEQSFTTSGSDLTAGLVITAPTNYEVSTTSGSGFGNSVTLTPTSGTVANTTIYTRLKSGLAVGTYNGTLTATSSGAPTKQITFSGSVSYSNSSDIIANTTYSYNSNIVYTSYQAATITNTIQSVDVFKFDIRDGGGASDADALGTELNAIIFNVTNNANIRSAALFAGNFMLNNSPVIAGNTISFSGLSGSDFTAADNSNTSVTLRVTFNNTVTDNQQLQFTIASATANPSYSVFSVPNAGGASSSVTGDRNRIEVTADRLTFVQQPVNTAQNAAMGTAPTIKAADFYGNIDFDYTTAIVITSTGTMTGAPISVVPTAGTGIATFAGIVHTSAGTYTLSATSGSLTGTTSNSFVISTFTFMSGDFRPLYTTDLSNNGAWEYYNGSSWVAVPDGKAPQNTTTTISRVLIDKIVTGGGSASKAYNCDFIIQSGGKLSIADDITNPTFTFISAGKKLEVLSNGTIEIKGDIKINSTGNLIIRDGGEMVLNQNSINNSHPMWDGEELFEGGSTVEIKNWDWADSGAGSLLNVLTSIADNANGYKFGNLIINVSSTTSFSLIGGGIGVVNLCENDFDISNSSTFFIHGATNKSGTNGFVVNGNMTIYDGNFSFGTSFSNDSFNHQFIINGDFECGSDDTLKIHHIGGTLNKNLSGSVTFKGDVKIGSSVSSFANDGGLVDGNTRMYVNFEGGTLENPKLIDIAPIALAIPMNIKTGTHRKLATQDLTTNSAMGFIAPFIVESDASLHFGWATNGTTPLVIKKTGSDGTNNFTSQLGSTLIITSLDGLQKASATTGNVQYASSNKTFNQTASFWYVGKDNQVTGDGISIGGSGKTIICDLIDNSKILTLSNATGISSPGLLNIKKGKLIETVTEYISGSDGGLTMEDGTFYSIVKNWGSSNLIPRLDGPSNTYNLFGDSTIELNGNNGPDAIDQNLRAGRHYRNLTFSNAGVKTVSAGITNNSAASVIGTVTVKDNAILDVGSKSMGGSGTNLTMTDFAKYRTGQVGVNPQAGGDYSLGLNTTIEFYQSSMTATNNSTVRLVPIVNYANIVVNGPLVANSGTTTGIQFQPGGTFTVKNGATFKLLNSGGFYDGTASNTAILNTNSPTITLEDGSTIEYIGENQTISDFSQNTNPSTQKYTNLTISGDNTKTKTLPTGSKTVFVNEDLYLKSSKLLLNVDEVITVKKAVIIDDDLAEMDLKANAQLIQINDTDANAGTNFKLERTATVTNTNYVYWSSPVVGFNIANVPVNNRYYWNPRKANTNGTVGDYLAATGIMQRATGYIVSSSSISSLLTNFLGKPHNGSFTNTIYRGNYDGVDVINPSNPLNPPTTKYDDNWNLVGNPYPSAISAIKFLNKNSSKIDGAIWVWKHGLPANSNIDPFYNDFVLNYHSTDYIKFNGMGSTPPGFDGIVATGQGFFVSMLHTAGTFSNTIPGTLITNDFYSDQLIFDNSLRSVDLTYASYDNTQFYRSSSPTEIGEVEEEKHRIWIDILNVSNNQVETMLLGYATNATLERDRLYDCFFIPRDETGLYSLIDSKPFIIQGRPLPFNVYDQVPLGIKIMAAGNHKIAIREVDGFFVSGVNIYLEDKLLNIIHDLRASPYDFTSVTGQFDDRFVLRYTTETLGNQVFDPANSVVVATNNSQIQVVSQIENISQIQVFDMLGRKIYATDNLDILSHTILNIARNQALIVKVKLRNGSEISKKIIVK